MTTKLAANIQTPSDAASTNNAKSADHFLDMRHVNVALGDRVVLHDINLSIATGEHVAILGANGCGKSTLIRTMTCELYPLIPPCGDLTRTIAENLAADTKSDLYANVLHRPHISIFGRARWDLTELRKHFGVVSADLPFKHSDQRTPLTPGRDAVIAGFFSASSLWPNLIVTEEMRQRADEALERVDATRLATQLVGEMSAGEKRRIMIARALVHRPRQILLDEPSNALDLAAQRNLRETMRSLMRPDDGSTGTGLILVTHHLGDIPPEIDRVILMQQGKIFADGPREKLLTAPVLSDLLGIKVNIGQDDGWLHSW
jgi:iron complex transport system ATP-binding protein